MPISHLSRIFDAIGDDAGVPDYIYKVIEAYPFRTSTPFLFLCLFCRNLRDALSAVCRFSFILSDMGKFDQSALRKTSTLVFTPNREIYISKHQIEGVLFGFINYAERIIFPDRSLSLVRMVNLAHQPRFDTSRYESYFGCPVNFGCSEYGIVLQSDALDTKIASANAKRKRQMQGQAECCERQLGVGDTFSQQVQQMFIQRMAFREKALDSIAEALAVSVRTLQRRLIAEGTSYRETVESARMTVAKQELRCSQRPLSEISELLGYSEQRAFRRAFREWTGSSPSEYRKRRSVDEC